MRIDYTKVPPPPKPCRVLSFCPYGPLVEQFPAPRDARLTRTYSHPVEVAETVCAVFGHVCPVFWTAEPFVDEPRGEGCPKIAGPGDLEISPS
jgi:hypothetical protein